MVSDLFSDGSRLDTARIDYLLDRGDIGSLKVLVAGAGSGGAAVVERLAMCGVSNWALFDPDVLEPVNLVKHPARRIDLGRRKVDVMAEWISDRNPKAEVRTYAADVTVDPAFGAELATTDVVVCAVDTASARSYLNAACVNAGRPAVFGSVFRTGLGGEVYAYLPGETGCFDCKLKYVMTSGTDIEDWLELTSEETRRIYGVGEKEFAASGLAVDIAVVAGLHAHYLMSLFGSRSSRYLSAPAANWITIGLRSVPGLFPMYHIDRLRLKPRRDCHLRCGGVAPDTEE
jgi:hypothetical protein